jgi:ribokinase
LGETQERHHVAANKPIAIVGSINMDLVVRAHRVPAPGETILGHEFQTIPGGKGANQAVAVGRLGYPAVMIGRVGDDTFGEQLRAGLKSAGVDTSHVRTTSGTPSGIAMIVVAAGGENAITVAAGANALVTPADIDAAEDVLGEAAVCLCQLELPLETVVHTLRVCRRLGVRTILDPAPAPSDDAQIDGLFEAEIVTPNETEARILSRLCGGTTDDDSPQAMATGLRRRDDQIIVLKLGHRGAYVLSAEMHREVAGFSIEAVDTTAAGDAFTGAMAVALAEGKPLMETIQFANATGALACTQLGAQPSMPQRQAVMRLLGGAS